MQSKIASFGPNGLEIWANDSVMNHNLRSGLKMDPNAFNACTPKAHYPVNIRLIWSN